MAQLARPVVSLEHINTGYRFYMDAIECSPLLVAARPVMLASVACVTTPTVVGSWNNQRPAPPARPWSTATLQLDSCHHLVTLPGPHPSQFCAALLATCFPAPPLQFRATHHTSRRPINNIAEQVTNQSLQDSRDAQYSPHWILIAVPAMLHGTRLAAIQPFVALAGSRWSPALPACTPIHCADDRLSTTQAFLACIKTLACAYCVHLGLQVRSSMF